MYMRLLWTQPRCTINTNRPFIVSHHQVHPWLISAEYITDCTWILFANPTFLQTSDLVNIWFSQEGREDSLSICKVKHCPFVRLFHCPSINWVQHVCLMFRTQVISADTFSKPGLYQRIRFQDPGYISGYVGNFDDVVFCSSLWGKVQLSSDSDSLWWYVSHKYCQMAAQNIWQAFRSRRWQQGRHGLAGRDDWLWRWLGSSSCCFRPKLQNV